MKVNGAPFEPSASGGSGSTRGSHRTGNALACRRIPYFKLHLGIAGISKYAAEARIGTAFHVLRLRRLLKNEPDRPTWAKRKAQLEAKRQCRPERLKKREWDTAVAMEKTDRKRPPVKPGWKIKHAEVEVFATLGALSSRVPRELRDEVVTSRLDTVFETPRGLVIDDIKTEFNDWSSKDLRDFDPEMPKWLAHWQACVNLVVGTVFYGEPVRAWYAYRVSRQPPYTGKRSRVEPADGLLKATPRLLVHAVREEQRALRSAPGGLRNVLPTGMANGHCSAYGGCQYLPLCSAENEEIFNNLVENDYVRTDDT